LFCVTSARQGKRVAGELIRVSRAIACSLSARVFQGYLLRDLLKAIEERFQFLRGAPCA